MLIFSMFKFNFIALLPYMHVAFTVYFFELQCTAAETLAGFKIYMFINILNGGRLLQLGPLLILLIAQYNTLFGNYFS